MKNICFLFLLFTTVSFAQDGSLDTSFGDNGISFLDFGSDHIHVRGINELSDGSYQVVAKRLTTGGPTLLVRFLNDGTLDLSYGDNGIITYPHGFPRKSWTVENDKTLVYTGVSGVGGVFRRYLNDGGVDTTFGNDGELIPFPSILGDDVGYINENNKIVCAGRDESYFTIKVYDLEGNPDITFGNNGQLSFNVNKQVLWESDLHFRPNIGVFLTICYLENSTRKYAMLKYLTNGELDTSFGENGEVPIPTPPENWNSNNYLSFFEDDSILINSIIVYDDMAFGRIYKTNSSGVYNTSFGVIQSLISSIIIQPNQRFLILSRQSGISSNGGRMFMNRYYAGGDVDPSFQFNTNDVPEVFDVTYIIDSQGKIVVTTSEYTGRNLLVFRLENDPLGISGFEPQKLVVTPNPTSGKFRVQNARFSSENAEYKIADVSGKIIKKGVLENAEDTIDISFAEKGIYFLKIQNQTFKLIKN